MAFHLTTSDAIVLATAALVATACALVGSFLVLRRMALIGDAISHAILPGIVIAFLLMHSRWAQPVVGLADRWLGVQVREGWVMWLGAAAFGLVTVWLVEALYRTRRLHEDTAIAVVFPALFALGVILIHRYVRDEHLDVDCVIYGKIELATAESLVPPLTMTLINLAFVVVMYNSLKLCTFDPQLGQALGLSPRRVHYLLMGAVALTTVACFDSVGAVLVVALLIVPPATAYLLTDRLWLVLMLAVVFGLLAAVTGYVVATRVLDTSVSGAMTTMAGAWFVLAWLAAPRHGLLATLRRRWRLRREFLGRLLLLRLWKTGPLHLNDLGGRFPRPVLFGLQRQGLLECRDGRLSLTPAGEEAARETPDCLPARGLDPGPPASG